MRCGDLVFVRGKSPISKLINLFDGQFSHVGIIVSDKGAVLESQRFTESRIVPFNYEDYEVVDLGLSEEQREEILKLAVDLTGIRYDYSQIFGLLLNRLFGTKGWNNPTNMICSELLVYLLFQIDWFEDVKEADRMLEFTPNELYRYLKTTE